MEPDVAGGRNHAIQRFLPTDRFDHRRRIEIERPDRSVESVAAPVAQHPQAEVVERPPLFRQVIGVEIALRRGAEPEIPSEPIGYRHGGRRHDGRIGEMGAAHFRSAVATKYLAHLADHSGADRFHRLADALAGVALISHLGDHLVALLGFQEGSRLPDVMGQRLLGVNVDPALHRRERGGEMRVIRGGNDHRVDVLVHLVEHHAEVVVKRLRGAPVLHVFRTEIAVHIAEGDEIFLAASLLVRLPRDPATRADESDVELAVSGGTGLADGEARENGARCEAGAGGEESSSLHGAGYAERPDLLSPLFSARRLPPSSHSSRRSTAKPAPHAAVAGASLLQTVPGASRSHLPSASMFNTCLSVRLTNGGGMRQSHG